MVKEAHTRHITLGDARKAVSQGQSQSDWRKADQLAGKALDAAILDDADEGAEHLDLDWSKAIIGLPPRKEMVNMRLDREVLDWFRSGGKGYQSRINAVLRGYVQSRGRAA
jgi:uncharacterized protein (DUF4415 family)